jgi:peptidoglycan/xylan/chitin deacetylase (PgdA/CDA1 family)
MQALFRLQTHVKSLRHAEAMRFVAATCDELGVPAPPRAVLDWDELRQLAREGVSMGSHARTHALLTRIPEEEARAEVVGAWTDLQREIPGALPILAYPAGAFDESVVRIVEEAGYALAFTTARGLNRLARAHPLRLSRINVGPRSTLGLLRAQLLARPAAWLPLSR